jgi:hypothetical protein
MVIVRVSWSLAVPPIAVTASWARFFAVGALEEEQAQPAANSVNTAAQLARRGFINISSCADMLADVF